MEKEQMGRWSRILRFVPGILCAAAGLILLAVLMAARMFPVGYLLLYLVVMVCLDGVVFLLTRSPQKRIRFSLGCILSAGIVAACILAGVYFTRTIQTIRALSENETTTSTVSFYGAASSPAQTLADAEDWTFGVWSNDRGDLEAALEQVKETYGFEPQTRAYPSLTELADAFNQGEIDGILMSDGYMALYEDVEGYEDFPAALKVLSLVAVEQTTEPAQTEETEPDQEETESDQDDIINVLISGSDTRGATVDQRGRSDVNIIVSANLKTHQVLLLSTPRDYFVALDLGTPNAYDKLTHAGVYGMDVLEGTLSKLYGIKIDYFFRLNFRGFTDIIDAMGGIEVNSDYAFDSGSYHFKKGTNQLDGAAAFEFVHNRYAFAAGDRQRGNNQIAVLKGAMKKALSLDVLTNYLSILESVEDCVYTNIPYDVVADLVRQQLENPQSWNVSSFSADGSDARHTTYSMHQSLYVMIPNLSTIEQAQEKLRAIGNTVSPSVGAYGQN